MARVRGVHDSWALFYSGLEESRLLWLPKCWSRRRTLLRDHRRPGWKRRRPRVIRRQPYSPCSRNPTFPPLSYRSPILRSASRARPGPVLPRLAAVRFRRRGERSEGVSGSAYTRRSHAAPGSSSVILRELPDGPPTTPLITKLHPLNAVDRKRAGSAHPRRLFHSFSPRGTLPFEPRRPGQYRCAKYCGLRRMEDIHPVCVHP